MFADATFWKDSAVEYSGKPVENPDAFERKIAITTSRLPPGAIVLHIGCVTGSLALRRAESDLPAPEAGGFFISSTVWLGKPRLPYGPVLRVIRWPGKAPAVRLEIVCEPPQRYGLHSVDCN